MANEFKIKKGLIVTGASGGTVVDIQGSQGQLFSVTDDLSGSIFAVSDISGVPIFEVDASGESTFYDNLNVRGNILLTGEPTTANQGRIIDFTGFDKEGTTDFSDRAYIQHTENTGGHSGSVLVISSQNDSSDGIAFSTHSSSMLKHNGNNILTAATTFGGDVSGTYNAIAVANDSHTHDGRYYTETESDARFTKYVDLTSQVQLSSYRKSVVALCNVDNTDIDRNSYSIGTLTFHRTNGLSAPIKLDIAIEKRYNAQGPNVVALGIGGNSFVDNIQYITFDYNGTTYGGIEFYFSAAQHHEVTFYGKSNFDIFGLDYLNTNGNVVLNQEVEQSISTANVVLETDFFFNNNKVWHAGNDGPDSGLDADTLDGQEATDFVAVTGDTMTGSLIINGDSTYALGVDGAIATDQYIAFIPSGVNSSPDMTISVSNNVMTFSDVTGGGKAIFSVDNVGIGTTSPDRQFEVYGTNDGYMKLDGGRTGNHGFTLGSDTYGFIIYDDTASAYRFVIDQDSGNVGIGTDSPDVKLHVTGEIRAYDTSNTYRAVMKANSNWGYFNTNAPRIYLNTEIRVDSGLIGSYNEALQLRTSGTTRMYIDNSNGNVGIGATSLSDKLHIEDSSAANIRLVRSAFKDGNAEQFGNQISFHVGGTTSEKNFANAKIKSYDRWDGTGAFRGALAFETGNGGSHERMRIDENGNVGIGTTSPTTALTIKKTHAANYGESVSLIDLKAAYPGYDEETVKAQIISGTSDKHTLNTHGGYLAFAVNQSGYIGAGPDNIVEVMRIEKDGNVGIGTSTPNAKLDVQGSQGQLFSVTDDLSGDIFSVADISGVPIMNVNSDGTSYFDGNVGIGTTTISGVTNAKLYVNGGIHLPSNRDISGAGGLAPHIGTGDFILYSGNPGSGSEKFRITNGGNVGIGTTDPGAKLSFGNVVDTNGYDIGTIRFYDNGAGTFYGIGVSSNQFNLRAGTTSDGFAFWAGNNHRMQIQATTGNVGIGNDNPSYPLDFPTNQSGAAIRIGDDNVSSYIMFSRPRGYVGFDSAGYAVLQAGATKGLRLNVNSNTFGNGTALQISDNGNVGIGTTSPDAPLRIDQDSNAVALKVTGGGGGTSIAEFVRDVGASTSVRIHGSSAHSTIQIASANNTFSLGVNNTTFQICDNDNLTANARLSIDNSGNVGIRTTDPLAEFHVQQANSGRTWAVHGNTVAIFENNAGAYLQIITGNSNEGEIWFSDAAAQARGRVRYEHSNDKMEFWTAGAERAFIDSNGHLHVDQDIVAYSSSVTPSDIRLKDNINTIDSALDKVKKLRGVEYTWNAGSKKDKKDLGVIAQEVEEVLPDIVREHKMDFIDEQIYKTVDYEKITAVLIEAIKEQQKQIDELKKQLDAFTK